MWAKGMMKYIELNWLVLKDYFEPHFSELYFDTLLLVYRAMYLRICVNIVTQSLQVGLRCTSVELRKSRGGWGGGVFYPIWRVLSQNTLIIYYDISLRLAVLYTKLQHYMQDEF